MFINYYLVLLLTYNYYMNKEKKNDKPISVKLRQSTKEALDKACHDEDRSISWIIERAVRKFFNLN